MVEADAFQHAAEIDLAHLHVVLLERLDDFSRYAKAHVGFSSPLVSIVATDF